MKQAGDATASFLINTTIGIIGLAKSCRKIRFKPQKEDVGQTLGSYGLGPGCYFVLPVLGPTTVRDSVGNGADTFVDPFAHVTLEKTNYLVTVQEINFRLFSVKSNCCS